MRSLMNTALNAELQLVIWAPEKHLSHYWSELVPGHVYAPPPSIMHNLNLDM